MTINIADLDIANIPPMERILIAQALLDSVLAEALPDLLTSEQIAEMNRRFLAVQRGEEATYSWEQVHADLLKLP